MFIGGRRTSISLADILQFVTGAQEEPILGFCCEPSIEFSEVAVSFLPTANTCINRLTLPRPTAEQPLPPSDKLFEFYDLAFSTRWFGNI